MAIKIRFATLSDYSKVRLFNPHSKYIDPKKIKAKLQNKEIIIAMDKSNLVGMIKFSYFWATRPFLDLIWVSEGYRSKGIGKSLLAYLEEYIRSNDYSYLFSSVEEKDKTAIVWHEKNGFIADGKITCLNLPHDTTAEIFFYKRISKKSSKDDRLITYKV